MAKDRSDRAVSFGEDPDVDQWMKIDSQKHRADFPIIDYLQKQNPPVSVEAGMQMTTVSTQYDHGNFLPKIIVLSVVGETAKVRLFDTRKTTIVELEMPISELRSMDQVQQGHDLAATMHPWPEQDTSVQQDYETFRNRYGIKGMMHEE